MDSVISIVSNIPKYIDLVVPLLVAAIAVAMVIPGDQPEKFLQGVVNFISKFSKK